MSVWLIAGIVWLVLIVLVAIASDGELEAILMSFFVTIMVVGGVLGYGLFLAGKAAVHVGEGVAKHPVQAAHTAGQVAGAFAKGAAEAP